MPASNYPGGFAYGVTVRGMPVLNAYPGNVFWVDSSLGSDGNPGTFNLPFSTVAGAMVACTANKGDIVMVKPGYTQTVAAAATVFSVAGVAVIGMGVGSMRPTITMSAAASSIAITKANVALKNFLFKMTFADVASVFTATGTATPTDFCLDGCEFRDTGASLNALTIVTGNATANSLDGLTVTGCRISSLGTTAATTAIKILAAADRVTITDNFYTGAALTNTAALLAHGALVVTNLDMSRNKVFRLTTDSSGGGLLITTSSTTNTGMVSDNYVQAADVAGALLVTAGCIYGMMNNLYDGDADFSGFVLPAIGTN